VEKALMIGSLFMVLVIELLNSSVEAAIDRISFEHHDLSKRAKDFGSAAVMLALLIALIIWFAVIYQELT
jgi:diacylglycerol kinase (ATP)